MFLQDVRYALRGLWHSKGFTAAALLCLGLGIGLNTTIFSIVDGVILKPYPFTEADRLFVAGTLNERVDDEPRGLSFPDFRDWQAGTTAVTLAGMATRSMTVSDAGRDPARELGAAVSWNLFSMLGVAPVVGQGFTVAHDQPEAPGAVVLSYELWQSRYAGDQGILGRSITVNGRPHAVVGVMPPRFAFPNNQRLWTALTPLVHRDARDVRGVFTIARLAPGMTREQATQALDGLAGRLAREYPATNEGWAANLRTLHEAFLPPDVSRVIWLMMAGATLVLFIACSNVANLLLARATGRRREIAVRAAIGAGRGAIIRQLLTESVVLSLVSLPLGLALAEIGTRLIASMMPTDQVPYYITWDVDARSLVYTVVIAVLTAVVFGLFPALQVSRGNLHESLKEGTRGNSVRRSLLRSGLVVAQVSLALVALVGALLFVRSFLNLDTYNFGFDVKPMMTMRFTMAGEPYEQPDARLRRVEDVVRRVRALPGVAAVFASNYVPLSGGGGGGAVEIDGRAADIGEPPSVSLISATPHILETFGTQVRRGRTFTESEGFSRSPVVIVNESAAAAFWPGADPLGRRFRVRGVNTPDEWFTVIGVMPDLTLYGIDPSDPQSGPAAFAPYAFQQTLNTGLTIRVSGGDPAAVTSGVRAALRESDAQLPLFQVRTMEDVRRLSFWQYGLFGWVFGAIGVFGLLLASIGVYGVLAYAVQQRTQEIGVRVALGATRGNVMTLVIRNGLWLAGTGVAIGLVLAPLGTRAAQSLLFNVSPFDPLSFALVAGTLLAVAVLASYVPARRALQVDPLTALRGD